MFTYIGKQEKEIVFREFVDDDSGFDQYISWLRDYETIKYIGRREYLLATNIESIYQYVKNLNNSPNDSFFKVFFKDQFVGTFKLGHIDWELGIGDLGIMLGDYSVKGKGLSVRIVRMGLEYGFQTLGLRKISGGCIEKNIPMQKCFKRAGFQKEGCFRKQKYIEGKYQDHIYYGIFKDEFV